MSGLLPGNPAIAPIAKSAVGPGGRASEAGNIGNTHGQQLAQIDAQLLGPAGICRVVDAVDHLQGVQLQVEEEFLARWLMAELLNRTFVHHRVMAARGGVDDSEKRIRRFYTHFTTREPILFNKGDCSCRWLGVQADLLIFRHLEVMNKEEETRQIGPLVLFLYRQTGPLAEAFSLDGNPSLSDICLLAISYGEFSSRGIRRMRDCDKGKQDHYATLGVDTNAPKEEVKKRYNFLIKNLHPDRHFGSQEDKKEAEAFTKRINEAWEVLSDPVRRREYDAKKSSDGSDPGGGNRAAGSKRHQTWEEEDFWRRPRDESEFRGQRTEQEKGRADRGNAQGKYQKYAEQQRKKAEAEAKGRREREERQARKNAEKQEHQKSIQKIWGISPRWQDMIDAALGLIIFAQIASLVCLGLLSVYDAYFFALLKLCFMAFFVFWVLGGPLVQLATWAKCRFSKNGFMKEEAAKASPPSWRENLPACFKPHGMWKLIIGLLIILQFIGIGYFAALDSGHNIRDFGVGNFLMISGWVWYALAFVWLLGGMAASESHNGPSDMPLENLTSRPGCFIVPMFLVLTVILLFGSCR